MTAREWRPMGCITAASLVLGAITVTATIRLNRAPAEAHAIPAAATEDYGRRLLAQTPEYLGPDVADPKMRYISSRLSCGSCHLGAGAEPGTLSLPESIHHYPRFSPRYGANTSIEDRVNECMQRSMNGRPLPKNSVEMIAITAYIKSLGDQDAASAPARRKVDEPSGFKTPNRAADLAAGKRILEEKCAACHQKDGSGLLAAANPIHGYVFPPLWGQDSFNTGAGMHRILTAAKFIKARMPLGKPDLTNDEAFDVAGYLNSMPRPEMANLQADYPDRKTKPIDNAYGPFADPFPLSQHQFGPFAPIEAFYKVKPAAK
ncbi:MAG TPA: c-type cytochrome [Bryobacteraceae bacterium]|nr:c-type cytochrome [Bryobacteraceae bacterium]